MKLTGLV